MGCSRKEICSFSSHTISPRPTVSLSNFSTIIIWTGVVEKHFFRDTDYLTLHYLYISRGIRTSVATDHTN